MSFPADGIEATYKNNIDDVRVYLDTKHPDNYVVINISQRSYRTSRLNDRVRNTIGFFNSLQISIPFLSPILDQFPFLFPLKTSGTSSIPPEIIRKYFPGIRTEYGEIRNIYLSVFSLNAGKWIFDDFK